MKSFFASKSVKATAFILIIAILLVVAFFGIYGIAQLDRKIKGAEKITGTVAENNWSPEKAFDLTDYAALTVPEGGELTVLMLTDTHLVDGGWFAKGIWTDNARNQRVYGDISYLVRESSPNFIYVTGDIQSSLLNDRTQQAFSAFMGAFGIPWTMTFGNHDSECRADKATLANILLAGENCIFQVGPTNLQGLGNTVIPILNGNADLLYAFILMDFGDWQQRYDAAKQYSTVEAGVTERQIAWYEWVVKGLAQEANRDVETMLLSHIPMHAFTYAVKLATFLPDANTKFLYHDDPFETESEFGYTNHLWTDYRTRYYCDGYRGESTFTRALYEDYRANDAFYKKIYDLGSTKQIASGHNHCDGYSVLLDGITFTSVVKTGEIYTDKTWDSDFRGGTLFKMSFKGSVPAISSTPLDARGGASEVCE